jgi:hypothetical protein
MKKIIALSLIVLSFSNCSNTNLNRKNAEKMISDFYEYPNVELLRISSDWIGNPIPIYYSQLVHDGYLTFKDERWRGIFYMTEKAEPFRYEPERGLIFIGNEIHFKEVTGIKFNETKNKATVYFTTARKNITAIAKSYGRTDGDTSEEQLNFELFDDGWRITERKPKNLLKKNDISFFHNDLQQNYEKNDFSKNENIYVDDPAEQDENLTKIIYTNVDNLRLRKSMGLNSGILMTLQKGTPLKLLGSQSPQKTTVYIEGKEFSDFWQKVQVLDEEGKIGWIHGCCYTNRN